MKPKSQSVIQYVLALLVILATFCSWPAVSGSLKGSAERLIEQRLQTDNMFKTAGSTPSTQTANKPISSKGGTYSSATVWSPVKDREASSAWQECNGLNCALALMKKSGASEESMNFTREISQEVFGILGYLETFEEKGYVDLGVVALPGVMTFDSALVLLNGSPSLVSPNNYNTLDISQSQDPNYPRLKKQYPELRAFEPSAGFISVDASSDGGQRFIFSYYLVDGCHACGVDWTASVAFDFSRDGTFKGTKVLKLIPAENLTESAPQCQASNERSIKTRGVLISDALPYAELSKAIYECPGNDCKDSKYNPSGWSVLDDGRMPCLPNPLSTDPSCYGDGFHAEAYRHNSTGQVVIAFEGTTLTSIKDWISNLAFLKNNFPPQYEHAIAFTKRIVEKYGTDCEKPMIVTGHSLGGGMAQYVALQHGLRAYVFNSAGLWAPTIDTQDPKSSLHAYIIRYEGQEYFGNGKYGALDLVSEDGQQFDFQNVLIPIKVSSWKSNFLKIHGMENLLQVMKEEVQGPAGKIADALPPIPYEDSGACPFEGCVYRKWIATKKTPIRMSRQTTSPVTFTINKGESVTAITGVVITTTPGENKVLKPIKIGDVTASVGDVVYILTHLGEGLSKMWYKGNLWIPQQSLDILDSLEWQKTSEYTWWVQIKNSKGQIGWTNQPEYFSNKDLFE